MEADDEMAAADADDQDPQSSKENLEVMKQRLKEIEEEAGALREMHAKVEKEMSVVQGLVFPPPSVSRFLGFLPEPLCSGLGFR
ncbi:polyadenylate-binding protein 1-like [Asparagus officinalis]|uniref:polyadenylate-binding protein 1-like n=1 Tax=Asparagus officinalis TaxID=4686 RepID=UPI00098E52D7|nr:polyadenylate-binding protein 1-like [Asparagus officinalis]